MARSVFDFNDKGSKGKNTVIMQVTKSLDNKGKIKGKNKKETKVMRWGCVHHRYTKRGRIKSTTIKDGNALLCTACKKEISGQFYKDAAVKKATEQLMDVAQQAKFLAVACNTSNRTIDYFSKFSIELHMFPKAYKRVAEIASNRGKSRKKKQRSQYTGSQEYGGWR